MTKQKFVPLHLQERNSDNNMGEIRKCTVNVDFIRFKYVVLAKYLHMSIFEFYLLIKQHSLILCKNLLWLLF
jgi:hypothetical protein